MRADNHNWYLVKESEDEHCVRQLKGRSHFRNYREYISLFEFQELISKFFLPSLDTKEANGYRQFISLLKDPEGSSIQNKEDLNSFCCLIYNLLPIEIRMNLDPYILRALNPYSNPTPIIPSREPVSVEKLDPSLEYFYPIFRKYITSCAARYYRMYRRGLIGSSIDQEDLEQEAIYGLNAALKSYDEEHCFDSFVKLCIKKRICTKCKYTLMEKRSGKKTFHASEITINGRTFDFIGNLPQKFLDRKIMNYDKVARTVSSTLKNLTTKETSNLKKAIYQDRSDKQILYKSIDNSLQRIRHKYLSFSKQKSEQTSPSS